MEIASMLAGERWSDHPTCTHPTLAAAARSVNDCMTDEGRPALATLIPEVIGLAGDDPRVPPSLVLICSQRALAAVPRYCLPNLHRDRRAANRRLRAAARQASASPNDRRQALGWLRHRYAQFTAPLAIHQAIAAIADYAGPRADGLLRDVLTDCIRECAALLRQPAADTDTALLEEPLLAQPALPVQHEAADLVGHAAAGSGAQP
jgi:hypothetical protein